jgi:HEAT repeat protein
MDDVLGTNLPELEAELEGSQKGDFDKLIAEAIRTADQRRIPPELLLRLARSEAESLRYCIRRMAASNLSRSEEASLVRLLHRTGWVQKLLDALLFTDPETAATVATVLQRAERGLDLRLAAHLQSEDPSIVMRSLELVEVIGKSRQMVPVLFGLLGHDDPRIQSKAALVVEKLDHDFLYTRQLLRHSDARVRANALEAIADRADKRTIEFLRQGAEDADHRVRSLAAVGLCRIGDPLGWKILLKMIQDPRVIERRSAAWAMGRCGTIESLPGLEIAARDDADERVRELASQGIQRIRERAARQNADPSQPESA